MCSGGRNTAKEGKDEEREVEESEGSEEIIECVNSVGLSVDDEEDDDEELLVVSEDDGSDGRSCSGMLVLFSLFSLLLLLFSVLFSLLSVSEMELFSFS